jgi:cytochrome P450
MLMRDPPDHTRLRGLVNRAFTPRVIEAMRPRVETLVGTLLDRVGTTGRMDVIDDLAYPLPVTMICELLGIRVDDNAAIRDWSAAVTRGFDAYGVPAERREILERAREGAQALDRHFRALLPDHRAQERGDLLGALIAARDEADRLSEDELVATCSLMFVAGHETSVNMIGNAILALLSAPEQWALLQRDRTLVPRALEECLRFDSPVQAVSRSPAEEVELGGRKLAPGALVMAVIGAGNRDPEQFAEPERLDVTREENRHLSFAAGIHFCLGAALARVEGQAALTSMIERFPRLRLAGEPERRESYAFRGLRHLPVAF